MRKHKFLKTLTLTAALLSLLLSAACRTTPGRDESKYDDSQESQEESQAESQEESASGESRGEESRNEDSGQEADSGVIKKLSGAADETGIYAIVITLSDSIADKGVVEMTYYGPAGSPQENSVVNVFRIEYYRTDDGTYEISTFYNGDIYQNQHGKTQVKVNNTFDAQTRAGLVVITYTPDGGVTEEIYRAGADKFR